MTSMTRHETENDAAVESGIESAGKEAKRGLGSHVVDFALTCVDLLSGLDGFGMQIGMMDIVQKKC